MLVARGQTELGKGVLRWALLFGRGISASMVERRGLVYDTRFVPAANARPKRSVCLYVLFRGAWQIEGEARKLDGPCAFVVRPDVLEGADGVRPYTFRAVGEPFQALHIYLRATDLTIPDPEVRGDRPVEVPLEQLQGVDLATATDDDIIAGLANVLRSFERARVLRAGVLDAALQPTPFTRLWSAVRPLAERFVLSPTVQQMGDLAGLSSRQLERHLQSFFETFGFLGSGWRNATRHLRVKLAVLFLSAEDVSVTEVATVVGYGSTDAMARAFRDAGLPAPSVIQAALRS